MKITPTVRSIFAKLFFAIFILLALAIICTLLINIVGGLMRGQEVIQILLSAVNTGIIALAVFELAFIINMEYSSEDADGQDIIGKLRTTIPRFIGTVCVALSLEGLIMVIKYSQLELAGNLYYPVAIITSVALLLIALAVFIFLTKRPT